MTPYDDSGYEFGTTGTGEAVPLEDFCFGQRRRIRRRVRRQLPLSPACRAARRRRTTPRIAPFCRAARRSLRAHWSGERPADDPYASPPPGWQPPPASRSPTARRHRRPTAHRRRSRTVRRRSPMARRRTARPPVRRRRTASRTPPGYAPYRLLPAAVDHQRLRDRLAGVLDRARGCRSASAASSASCSASSGCGTAARTRRARPRARDRRHRHRRIGICSGCSRSSGSLIGAGSSDNSTPHQRRHPRRRTRVDPLAEGCRPQLAVRRGQVRLLVVGVEAAGVGQHPHPSALEALGLLADGGLAGGERDPVRRDPEERDERRLSRREPAPRAARRRPGSPRRSSSSARAVARATRLVMPSPAAWIASVSLGCSVRSVNPASCSVRQSRLPGRAKCSPDQPEHSDGLIPTSSTRFPARRDPG